LFIAAAGHSDPPPDTPVVCDIEVTDSVNERKRLFDVILEVNKRGTFAIGRVILVGAHIDGVVRVKAELARRKIAVANVCEANSVDRAPQRAPLVAYSSQLLQCAIDEVGSGGKAVWDMWPLYRDDELHKIFNSTGMGVRVAILDSGIDAAHPDVRRQLRGFRSFVPGEADAWLDPNGHGTMCASIIAAVAPDCGLFVGKVLRDNVTSPSPVSLLSTAIHWAVDDAKCNVISISAGTSTYDAGLCYAVNYAIAKGAIVVTAAANYGRLHQSNIAYPAAFGNTICVGSHDEAGQVSRFSSAGALVDFLAPGETILAAKAGTGKRIAVRGTSMAAAFGAGLAALLVGGVRHRRLDGFSLDNETARVVMRKLCTSPGRHDDACGYGLLKPMEQLGAQSFEYIDKWVTAIHNQHGVVSAMHLRRDKVNAAATRVNLDAANRRSWRPRDRFLFYISAALIPAPTETRGSTIPPTCYQHFYELCKSVRNLILAADTPTDTDCAICKALLSRVCEISKKDCKLICHFLNNVQLKDDHANFVLGTWEVVVRLLLFGDHGVGDDLGCWLPGPNFSGQKLYQWPNSCACLRSQQQRAQLRGVTDAVAHNREDSCPFWSDGFVEYEHSDIPLKHMGHSDMLSKFSIKSVEDATVLHHPVICEVNKINGMRDGAISHACVRPSHLMCGASVTNELHEMMNAQVTAVYGKGKQSTPSRKWVTDFVCDDERKWASDVLLKKHRAEKMTLATGVMRADEQQGGFDTSVTSVTSIDNHDDAISQPDKRARTDQE
jgi:hypothetical protein